MFVLLYLWSETCKCFCELYFPHLMTNSLSTDGAPRRACRTTQIAGPLPSDGQGKDDGLGAEGYYLVRV